MGDNVNQSSSSLISLDAVSREFSKQANISPTEDGDKLSFIDILKKTSSELRERKSKAIVFSRPLVTLNEEGILFPRTITVIQGQSGSHKSRVAELFASIFLGKKVSGALGFLRNTDFDTTVCYIDTERNLVDQFPCALQRIQIAAGFNIIENPPDFNYISLMEIQRTNRFRALENYLQDLRNREHAHIFIILDVISDCIADFNKTEDSMQLIDMLNMMINRYNVTFLCIIHENPNQQKARGHLGTELFNKATTVIQLQLESESNGVQGDLLRIRFLKCRNSKLPSPIYAKFDPAINQLVEAGADSVKRMKDQRTKKASESETLKYLGTLTIGQPYPKTEIVESLMAKFSVSNKIADQRLSRIADNAIPFQIGGENCLLKRERSQQVTYCITKVDDNE